MKIIKKKIWPEYYEAIASGKRNMNFVSTILTLRKEIFFYLEEWNPKTKEYTGRKIERKVTYVGKFKIDQLFWPKEQIEEKGIQIIGN
jgi:hypothetical protein